MQTTLLGLGIAIILALVAALVGPYFIDWSDHRGWFEARASRIVGMPVRITGPIDLRLLPVPSVTLRGLEARSTPGRVPLKARELGIEFALGPLVQGEWRATEMQLVGPELALGLDANGRFDWPGSATGIDADALSIQQLSIQDGRVMLADAGSGSRHTLEKLWFNGDMRSLAGPVKGEGEFVLGEERHRYKLSAGRMTEVAGMRLRLSVDPSDKALGAEAEGTLRVEAGAPRFEGALTLSRTPGVVLANGRAVATEPWRLSGKFKASPASALFEQLELQYGADDRALKLGGTADLTFGAHPRLDAVVAARQLDLDRFVTLPENTRRLPLVAIQTTVEALGATLLPSIPVQIGVSVDVLTLADASVTTVRGDISADDRGWNIETLEFRAPGTTQVRASGRLTHSPQGTSFAGPASIEAADARALVAWLEGRAAAPAAPIGFRGSGKLTVAPERIAVDHVRAEVDRKTVAGSLDYAWGSDWKRPRLDAELSAAELDVDAALALIRTAFPAASFDFPAELTLALDVGRATMAGFEAKNAKAKLKLDESGLAIEQLAVGDFAGASLDASGRVDAPWSAPRGAVTLDIAGERLDGMLAVLDKAAPQAAEFIRSRAARLTPAKLRLTLALDRIEASHPAAPQKSTAKIRLDGTAGPLRLVMSADASGNPLAWAAVDLRSEGRMQADDGRALAALFALEQAVVIGSGAGSVNFTAAGPLGGELAVQGRFAASGVDLTANGTVQLVGDAPAARGEVAANVADVFPWRDALGRPDRPLPLAFKARADWNEERLLFTNLGGKAADTTFGGRLVLTLAQPLQVDGRLETNVMNVATLVSALAGMPTAVGSKGAWSAEPAGPRFLNDMAGRVEFSATRAALTPALEIRQMKGSLRLTPTEAALEDIEGVLAGGKLQANVTLQSAGEGTSAVARLALSGADAAALVPGDARSPLTGRVSLQLEAKGSGRSPSALVGALGGAGTISVERLELAGLDPRVFDSVTRATDQAMNVDAVKVKAVVDSSLYNGRLRIDRADGALTISAGQLRLGSTIARGDRADLGVTGNIDLVQWLVDARLALLGPAGADGPAAGRPEISIALKGPPAAPTRTTDVSPLVGWLTLRAVELQSKRLEAAEAERRNADEAAKRVEEAAARRSNETEAARRAEAERAAETRRAAERTQQQAVAPAETPAAGAPSIDPLPTIPPSATPMVRPSEPGITLGTPPALPGVRRPQSPPSPPAAEQAPALPPPIDIRPAPGTRRPNAQRSSSGPEQEVGLRPPREIRRPPRSMWDNLFGR